MWVGVWRWEFGTLIMAMTTYVTKTPPSYDTIMEGGGVHYPYLWVGVSSWRSHTYTFDKGTQYKKLTLVLGNNLWNKYVINSYKPNNLFWGASTKNRPLI